MVVNRYIVTLFFEKEKMNMKRILKTYPVVSTLSLTCLLLGLLTSFLGMLCMTCWPFIRSRPMLGSMSVGP